MSEGSIEERLRKLAESGELSGLPGEGRPFTPEDLGGDDPRWAAFRLMKNNQVIPVWSQARMEIEDELARLRARARAHRAWLERRRAQLSALAGDRIVAAVRDTEREDQRVWSALEDAVAALNVQVDRYNALVPAESLRLGRFSAAALLASAP